MSSQIVNRLRLPAISFVVTFVAALTLWQLLMRHRRVEIEAVTNQQATFMKAKMESELRARILPLATLARRWAFDQPDDIEMESDAALLMSGYPFQAVEWVDPEFHVRWVTPRGANESDLGMDMSTEPRRRVALESARVSREPMLTRPVSVGHGDLGVLICLPVYSSDEMRGFVLGVFTYHGLISSILQDVEQDYWVAVYDGDEQIYSDGGSLAPQDAAWARVTDVHFQQTPWRVQVWPKPATISYALSILPRVTFIGGILMAVLLAVAVYLAQSASLHAEEVVAANRELKGEIAGREQAEQSLREAHKMEAVGRLAGGVAHDFNNLLMVIRGNAALSLNKIGSNDPLASELNEILKSTDRASSLTRSLLAFSRKQVLQLHVIDLNTLVNQVKDLLPPVLGDDINLIIDLDPELGRVKADFAQMEQVIMNLVFNGRDAMPYGGELTIKTRNQNLSEAWVLLHPEAQIGPHVMLAVRDTGYGMDENTQSHIFEPFFTTKDRTKGTGLGLATVHGTVRQSGGSVTASSKLGEGTTVEIYLPRVEDPLELDEAPGMLPDVLLGSETVLVVEDDAAVRKMASMFLKLKGYRVIEASSASRAIDIVKCEGDMIDLVLTDVLMPGMKGRELVGCLGEMRSELKVLYMSAYTEDAAINIGVLNPGTEFIEKPFSPDELARKVRQVLSGTPTLRSTS